MLFPNKIRRNQNDAGFYLSMNCKSQNHPIMENETDSNAEIFRSAHYKSGRFFDLGGGDSTYCDCQILKKSLKRYKF